MLSRVDNKGLNRVLLLI